MYMDKYTYKYMDEYTEGFNNVWQNEGFMESSLSCILLSGLWNFPMRMFLDVHVSKQYFYFIFIFIVMRWVTNGMSPS